MTTQRKFEIAGAIVLIIVMAIFLRQWIGEREARIRAEASARADEKIVATSDASIKARDAQAAQYAASLAQQAAAVQTPQQAAQVILHYLPTPGATQGQPTPAPQTIATVSAAQLSPELQKTLPAAPEYGILTDLQLRQVAKDELACDATRKELSACTSDQTDLRTQIAAKSDESDKWQAAAQGGTKWQRFGRVMKYVACAGGGAAAGELMAKGRPGVGAAIGGAAGVGVCSLF